MRIGAAWWLHDDMILTLNPERSKSGPWMQAQILVRKYGAVFIWEIRQIF